MPVLLFYAISKICVVLLFRYFKFLIRFFKISDANFANNNSNQN